MVDGHNSAFARYKSARRDWNASRIERSRCLPDHSEGPKRGSLGEDP